MIYKIRTSTLSKILFSCLLRLYFELTKPLKQEDSENLSIGREVHNVLSKLILNKPLGDLSDDVKNILFTKAKFETQTFAKGEQISDIISKDMFINEIIMDVERPFTNIEFKISENNSVIITGTPDIITDKGITDWKTSSAKPSVENKWGFNDNLFDYTEYYLQVILYCLLHCKERNEQYSEKIGRLAYIVKTKTPQFCSRLFFITPEMLVNMEKQIIHRFKKVIGCIDKKIYPDFSFSPSCCYCNYKRDCTNVVGIWPDKIIEE